MVDGKPHTLWNDVRGFFILAKTDRVVRLRLALAIGLLFGGGTFFVLNQLPGDRDQKNNDESKLTLSFPEDDARPRRNIDGVRTELGSENPRLVAVMVENMVDARPISGLADASLVFEAPVEAGITRMLAVYSADTDVSEIGPVRSARPYYLDWALELHALFAHVGGSPEALERIAQIAIDDLNEFAYGRYFWRSSRRSAPHNVYTSTSVLAEALEDVEVAGDPDIERWIYKEDSPLERSSSTGITVPFSTPAYEVMWQYNPETNLYLRYQAGEPHRDKNGKTITAKNVAVVYTDIEVIDEVGRRRIRTVGDGRALVSIDGKTREAEWRKEGSKKRLRFFENGVEVLWNAGPTWIEIVPKTTKVVYNE